MKLLTALAAGAFLILTGCNAQKDETVPGPAAFDKHDRCLICGMVILNYPGAKAQIYISGEANPLKFCSVKDGFVYFLQPENARRLKAFYVSDYGRQDAAPLHTKMLKAQDAVYVAASDVHGAMGKSILPFASQEAARSFAAVHGGNVLTYSEINFDVLKSLKGH